MKRDSPRGAFTKDAEVDRSLRHSLYDGVTYSVMSGAGESYFSAFAMFLKANTAQIGLLASLPTLIGSLFQLFSVWLGRRTGHRKAIVVGGAVLQASALLAIAVLPLLFPDYAFVLLLVCAVFYFAGPHLGTPQWGSMMGDLVPEARRGRFFGLRTRLASVSGFLALTIAGVVLQIFASASLTYWGFFSIFVVATLSRLVSAYHLACMLDPTRVASAEPALRLSIWKRLRSSPMARFSLFFASMQFSVAIASPYFVVYMLRDLQFSYLQWTINTSVSVCFQFLTLNRWGRLSDLFGNRLILLTTGLVIPFLPSLWTLSTNYFYLLGIQALSGLVWAGFSLSGTNFVFDLTPSERRATLMAYHNVLTALAVFSGAMVGGYLATHLPREISIGDEHFQWQSTLYGVFLISTGMRSFVMMVFLPRVREVRNVRSMSVAGVLFRVTRFHPMSGLNFDILGLRSRSEKSTGKKPDEIP